MKGRRTALWGAWLQLGPVFGLIGTVIGMLHTFYGISLGGEESTTSIVATGIHMSLFTTQIGLAIGLVGTILLLVALFHYKFRARWFFWFMIIFSGLTLLAFPVGTIIAIFLLIYLIRNKDDFWGRSRGEQGSAPNALQSKAPSEH